MDQHKTSRRMFIKAAGAAAFVASAPMIIADDKPLEKNPIIGEGEYKYECIHGWAKLPEGMRFGNTHMVQEDAQGRIFIHHQGGAPDSIAIFDPDGKFIKSWGKEWRLDGEQVYVLEYPKDAKNSKGEPCYKETETTKNGKTTKTPAEARYNPTNIAFGPNGDFYVADGYGSNYVHQYNIKGEYIRTFGGSGSKDGQLSCPHGIFTDTRDAANPRILVADRSNERLQYFSMNGEHIATIKPAGEPNPYRAPCHFDQRGDVLVCPGLKGRVSILDKDNKVIAILGDNPDSAWGHVRSCRQYLHHRVGQRWPGDEAAACGIK